MKRILPLFSLILVLATVSVRAVPAQEGQQAELKIAFVNTTAILQGTAEGKQELAKIEQYIAEQRKGLEEETNELNSLQQQFNSQSRMLNPDTAAEMQLTISDKEKTLRRKQEDIEVDINRQQNKLLSDMSEKVRGIIQEYAEQNGIGVVFLRTPNLPFLTPVLDITQTIIGLYDQKFAAASADTVAAPQAGASQNP
jgi:Skp family chaperone for outer membrane proteins